MLDITVLERHHRSFLLEHKDLQLESSMEHHSFLPDMQPAEYRMNHHHPTAKSEQGSLVMKTDIL